MEKKGNNLESQQLYATLLLIITNIGLGILLITFVLYIFGIFQPLIPLEELPQYWSLPLQEFIEKTGAPVGWGWVDFIGKGDYMNFIGMVIFIGVTGFCYLVLLVDFIKKSKMLYASLVSLELLFIVFAASNIVAISH